MQLLTRILLHSRFAACLSCPSLLSQANGLGPRLDVPAGAFLKLSSLDLSFNMLSSHALAALSRLPALRTLDLTCNEIADIPAELAAPPHPGDAPAFARLEALALGSNSLDGAAVAALSALPSLKVLLLPKNRISALPAPPSAAAPGALPPAYFPALQAIDLASNLIAAESGVAPLAAAPQLIRIVLWGNPVAALVARAGGSRGGSSSALGAPPTLLGDGSGPALLVAKPAVPGRPTVTALYSAAPPAAIDGALSGVGGSGEELFSEFSSAAVDERLAGAFERLDEAIAAAHFRGEPSGQLEALLEHDGEAASGAPSPSSRSGRADGAGAAGLQQQQQQQQHQWWLDEEEDYEGDDPERTGIFLTAVRGQPGELPQLEARKKKRKRGGRRENLRKKEGCPQVRSPLCAGASASSC